MDIIHPFGGKTAKYETEFANKKIIVETGNMAFRADGAVTVRCGDTMVLATAVVEPKPRPDTDFFPLLIDYEERWYASGKISGSRYVKREAKPSDKAVLTSRLIDRPIRPLFPKGYRNDVQVVVTVLSADLENEPDILSIIAASTALMLSGCPFEGPVAAARIGQIDGKLVGVLARANGLAGLDNGVGALLIKQFQLAVCKRRGLLDIDQGHNQLWVLRDWVASDREVLQCPQRMNAVVRVCRHLAVAKQVMLAPRSLEILLNSHRIPHQCALFANRILGAQWNPLYEDVN